MAQDPLYYFRAGTTQESIDSENAWNERIAGVGMAISIVLAGLGWAFEEEPLVVALCPVLGVGLWAVVIWQSKRRRFKFLEWEAAVAKEAERREAVEAERRRDLRRRYLGESD